MPDADSAADPRHDAPLSTRMLFAVVFIEGFCSLGAEVIALRQLVPHVGSSIVITAPTIGLFLLALAFGYHSGARREGDYRQAVMQNFLIAAVLCGAGLAGITVELLFTGVGPGGAPLAYLMFVGAVLCPIAWLLGQTVPLLTNVMPHNRRGEASGYALYYSTLGSFLGSAALSLLVMQWLGVSAAVFVCAALLLLGYGLLGGWSRRTGWDLQLGSGAALGLTVLCFVWPRPVIETAHANYTVEPVALAGTVNARVFMNNRSPASLLDDSQPPRHARYIERLRQVLLHDLGWRDRQVLVLGAGGFTLSHQEPLNHYTYVDIDPAIGQIAETRFLHGPIQGRFIVDDARHFVLSTSERFDAVLVDVYSAQTAIPGHLVTREFWLNTRQVLPPTGGLLMANLLLDRRLSSPYARNLLATIESVYGRCAVEVLQRQQALSNVLVLCEVQAAQQGASPESIPPTRLYVDERNTADLDVLRSNTGASSAP